MKIKSLEPIFQWLSSRYRTITSRRLRQRFLKLYRVNFLALVAVFVGTFGLLAAGGVALGNSEGPPYSVSINHKGQIREVSTSSPTVRDLLASLEIELGPLDIVRPSTNAFIDEDDYKIEILQGYYVRIIDGDNQALEITV